MKSEERFYRKESDKDMYGRLGGGLFGAIQIGLFVFFTLIAFSAYLKAGIQDRYDHGRVDEGAQVIRLVFFAIPVFILIGPWFVHRMIQKRRKRESEPFS